MSDKEACALDLQNSVERCLAKLRRLLLAAEIYGSQENARLLYDVVTVLEDAVPLSAPPENSFLVDSRYRTFWLLNPVSRFLDLAIV